MKNKKSELKKIEKVILWVLVILLVLVPTIWPSEDWVQIVMAVMAFVLLGIGGIIAYRREKRGGSCVQLDNEKETSSAEI